jgi:hypothetical protein
MQVVNDIVEILSDFDKNTQINILQIVLSLLDIAIDEKNNLVSKY